MGKFVIKEVKTGIMFNLKAGNGEIIATSEIYTTEDSCRKGIASRRKSIRSSSSIRIKPANTDSA